MSTSENPAAKPGLLPWLATHRVSAGTGVIVAGIAIAVLPTLLASWYGSTFAGTIVALAALALLVLGVGVMLRFSPPDAAENPGRLLGLVLALGGVGGLFVALTGIALTIP